MKPPRIRVVGCGNPDAADDAAGLLIARGLRERLPQTVEVRAEVGGGVNLLRWCENVELLILVDAARATAEFPAGQWRRFTYPGDRECLAALPLFGTHVLGLAEALELAYTLGRLPQQVFLFVLAGAQFRLGAGLSPAVRTALTEVTGALEAEVTSRLQALAA